MSVQKRIHQVSVFSSLLFFLVFSAGCFSGASPGMKVLKITAEQYFNDSIRYLDQPQFLYDQSKINTAVKNLEDNSGSGDSEAKRNVSLMIDYLRIMKQYSGVFKSSKRPDKRELERIYDDLIKKTDDEYIFLRLFHLFVKSYDRKPLTGIELFNTFSISEYLIRKDYIFPFRLAGEVVDANIISYMRDSVFMQHKYFDIVKKRLDISLDENKLDPDVLLRAGEFYFRAGLYDESLRFLKYFRLPTFSEYGLRDHCLNIMEKIYEKKKMETDRKVIQDKIVNRFSSRFDRNFAYISDEEIALYENTILAPEKDKILDMLDLSSERDDFYIRDYNTAQQKELLETLRIITDDSEKFSPEFSQGRDFYDIIHENRGLVDRDTLLLFEKDVIVILPLKKMAGYFVKADNVTLKKRDDNSFIHRIRGSKENRLIEFNIECSNEKGIIEEKIILHTGDFE